MEVPLCSVTICIKIEIDTIARNFMSLKKMGLVSVKWDSDPFVQCYSFTTHSICNQAKPVAIPVIYACRLMANVAVTKCI